MEQSGIYPTSGWELIVTSLIELIPLFTLTPRFIISIRALYARDLQGRRGEGIDTGFGLSSGRNVRSTLVFADVEQNGEMEDIEEVPGEGEMIELEARVDSVSGPSSI